MRFVASKKKFVKIITRNKNREFALCCSNNLFVIFAEKEKYNFVEV